MAEGIDSFTKRTLPGLGANRDVIENNLQKNLMLVTNLNPIIGYDNVAKIAKYALKNNSTLRESAIKLEILSGEDFDKYMCIDSMI